METRACCICMEELELESTAIRPCPESPDHTFCETCFRDWCLEAKVHMRRLICPLCRTKIREDFTSIMEGESRQYFFHHPEKLEKILNYRGGKFHGSQKYYYQHCGSQDLLELELQYKDGILDGIQRRYKNTFRRRGHSFEIMNVISMESPYVNGKCHGICREWHLNGKLKTEYTMEEGFLQGEYKVYNGRGKLLSVTVFEKGVMQEMEVEGEKIQPFSGK